jgi:tetratricopeptide (TPR) repeat protein
MPLTKVALHFNRLLICVKEASVKHFNDLYNFYAFLKSLANLYLNLGRTEEAIVVAETGLRISDLLWGSNVSDRMNNRSRMLLYHAQSQQINSTNSVCDCSKEISLAEKYYLTDRGSTEEFALRKDLSYANFLCEQGRFAEAYIVLPDMKNLGKLVWNKFVFCTYFLRAFYGPVVQKSVEVHGELLATVGDILYSSMVRVLVAIGNKDEAVAAFENLTANLIDVHTARAFFKDFPVGGHFLKRDLSVR